MVGFRFVGVLLTQENRRNFVRFLVVWEYIWLRSPIEALTPSVTTKCRSIFCCFYFCFRSFIAHLHLLWWRECKRKSPVNTHRNVTEETLNTWRSTVIQKNRFSSFVTPTSSDLTVFLLIPMLIDLDRCSFLFLGVRTKKKRKKKLVCHPHRQLHSPQWFANPNPVCDGNVWGGGSTPFPTIWHVCSTQLLDSWFFSSRTKS